MFNYLKEYDIINTQVAEPTSKRSEKNNFRRTKCMTGRKIRKAVRITSQTKYIQGRKIRTQRHIDINAPVGDFSPIRSEDKNHNSRAKPKNLTEK